MDPTAEVVGVGDLVAKLATGGLGAGEPPIWFRGCSDVEYALTPSVFRPPRDGTNEMIMLKRFMQDAHFLLSESPADQWEWLFLAQHHGVPTRLLDWSENPLVGLYFASESESDGPDDPDRPGGLWVLSPVTLNATSLGPDHPGLPMLGVDKSLDHYHPIGFDTVHQNAKPAAGLAMKTFWRISAQWGTFTVHVNADALNDEPNGASFLQLYEIPADAKASIREELSTLGIEDRTVYPDLHHLGQSIKERY